MVEEYRSIMTNDVVKISILKYYCRDRFISPTYSSNKFYRILPIDFEINTTAVITQVNAENIVVKNTSIRINHIDTVILGQLSPKKPNVGKPVQQMRVYILIFNSEKFTNKF